jgi:hypothetical protein
MIEPADFEIEPDMVAQVRVGLQATNSELISKNIIVSVEG